MVPVTAGRRERLALHLVQLGLVLVVLIALPYKTFDLDRFFVPKELVLHATAVIAAFLCLSGRRRLELSFSDICIAGFLVLSLLSAIFAQNWWLAGRALAITVSGALLFWVGITLRAAGLQRQVLSAVAVAVVVRGAGGAAGSRPDRDPRLGCCHRVRRSARDARRARMQSKSPLVRGRP